MPRTSTKKATGMRKVGRPASSVAKKRTSKAATRRVSAQSKSTSTGMKG